MEADTGPGAFAGALRGLRESRSLTQEELAERSGVTAKAIGALERGERRRPYPHTVRSLADGLGLDDGERAGLLSAVPRRSPTSSSMQVDGSSPLAEQPASVVPSPTGPTIGRSDELRRLLDLVAETAETAETPDPRPPDDSSR